MSAEDRGFQLRAAPPHARRPGSRHRGARPAFVVGLGARVLSRHHDAGRDIMKLSAILVVAGFGVRAVVDGGLPKSLS